MKYIVVGMLVTLMGTSTFAGSADKNKNRMEELFMWKVSDALALDQKEESEFKRVMEKIRDVRNKRTAKIDETLRKLDKADSKEKPQLLAQYKDMLKEYNSCQVEEVEELEKLLGTERVAKYLVLKDQLLNRLKGALADASVRDTRDKSLKTKVKDPKIIQDE